MLIWVGCVVVALGCVLQHLLYLRVKRLSESMVGTPSASHNSSSREIPSFVECMAHVRGMQHWSMSERPVVECQKLYDYIARNIGR